MKIQLSRTLVVFIDKDPPRSITGKCSALLPPRPLVRSSQQQPGYSHVAGFGDYVQSFHVAYSLSFQPRDIPAD